MRALLLLSAVLASQAGLAATAPHEAAPMLQDNSRNVDAAAELAALKKEFSAAYARAQKPRLAIYLNRELSDQVEEWQTPLRAQAILQDSKGELRQAEAALHFRDFNENLRDQPPEDWSWAFEDGFFKPLLAQKVKLVDRRTIWRLAAQQRPETAKGALALKHIEMDALRGHADILIELLVQQSDTTPSGYNFKVQATDINNGRVLALVNAHDIAPRKGAYIAGPRGYEQASGTAGENIQEVAELLAYRLMQGLNDSW